jgi:site-specific recombinase XerD
MTKISTPFTPISDSTRRAIAHVLNDFKHTTQVNASQANQSIVEQWLTDMKHRKLSVSTIRQRISILHRINPSVEISLPKREIPEHVCIDADQLVALLSMIPTSFSGHHDFALIALCTAYGLRNSEIRTLRWNQIVKQTNGYYAIHLTNQTIFLPDSFQILIKAITKNIELLNQNDYIFKAISKRYQNLPCVNSFEYNKSISSSEFNRRVKKYARMAKLDEKKFTVRTFRYTLEFLGQEQVIKIIEKVLKKRFPQPVSWKSLSHDPRLHGLGRRSR